MLILEQAPTIILFCMFVFLGNLGTEKITERDFTQDDDYITKSLSPYPKAVSPEFLSGNNRVVGQGKSPIISETSAICVRKSCSPASGLPFLVRI